MLPVNALRVYVLNKAVRGAKDLKIKDYRHQHQDAGWRSMGFVFGAKKLPIGAAPDTLGVMQLLAAKVPLIKRLAVAVLSVILLLAAASGSLIGLSPCFMATLHSFGVQPAGG